MRGVFLHNSVVPARMVKIQDACVPEGVKLIRLEGLDHDEAMEKIKALGGKDFYLAGDFDITDKLMSVSPFLKLVQLIGVGYDAIDVEAATKRGIPVGITPGANSVAVAEHTVMFGLSLAKNVINAHNSMASGEWKQWDFRPDSFELLNKTWGIVGFGRIGQEVARRASAFGMEILYYDVIRPDRGREEDLGATFVPLEELLRRSDVVSVHVSFSEKTRHMFKREQFELMKKSAVFINTSRGKLVLETDLYDALSKGILAGAGLDVFYDEPLPADNPLRKLSNVVLTPHMAGGSRDTATRVFTWCFDNVVRIKKGEKPINVVNPAVLEKRS